MTVEGIHTRALMLCGKPYPVGHLLSPSCYIRKMVIAHSALVALKIIVFKVYSFLRYTFKLF